MKQIPTQTVMTVKQIYDAVPPIHCSILIMDRVVQADNPSLTHTY